MPQRHRCWKKTCSTSLGITLFAGTLLAGPAAADESTTDRHGGGSWLPATPSAWNLVVDQSTTPAATITKGVTERSDTLDTVGGRQHTQVMDVDLADPNVRLGDGQVLKSRSRNA